MTFDPPRQSALEVGWAAGRHRRHRGPRSDHHVAADHGPGAPRGRILRVALADLGHYVTQRKPHGRRLLAVVDEFSAVVGARDHAIHLAERGRSANAATVLAVQSGRGPG